MLVYQRVTSNFVGDFPKTLVLPTEAAKRSTVSHSPEAPVLVLEAQQGERTNVKRELNQAETELVHRKKKLKEEAKKSSSSSGSSSS
jgi:hypothetical protein